MAKNPPSDLRVQAAEKWAETHHQSVKETFRDTRFQNAFNRYLNRPNDKTRKPFGFKGGSPERERAEQRLIRTLKLFGDTP